MYALDEIAQNPIAFQQAVAARAPFQPLYVKFKLIYGCNLKCEMCNHWREIRPPPLSFEPLQRIIKELAELGCRKIHFSGGEPLLRPQTPDLVAYASALGLRVTLTTNGTLIDKHLAKRLVQSGLRGINLSIDSPIRKVHDRVRGVDGAWKKACRAVEYFRRYAHKGKLSIRLNTVVSRSNYTSLSSLPEFAHQLGAQAIQLIPVDDHCGEQISLKRRHIIEYNTAIAPLIAEKALQLGLLTHESQAYPYGRSAADARLSKYGKFALGWYDRHPCFAPWTHSLVDYNGLVYVCCMTREQLPPLGDLKQQSFSDIWFSANYEWVRRQMFPPKLSPCQRCDDFLAENRRLYQLVQTQAPTSDAQLKSENISSS